MYPLHFLRTVAIFECMQILNGWLEVLFKNNFAELTGKPSTELFIAGFLLLFLRKFPEQLFYKQTCQLSQFLREAPALEALIYLPHDF